MYFIFLYLSGPKSWVVRQEPAKTFFETKEEAIEYAKQLMEVRAYGFQLGKEIKIMKLVDYGKELKDIKFVEVEL